MALLCVLVGLMALAGTLLLLPVWTAGLVTLLQGALTRWGGMVGRLAGDQLARQRQRTTLTAGALAVGLAAVVALSGVLDVTISMVEDLIFGLMKDDFGLVAFAADRTLEHSDPIAQPNLQEWPRDVLAAIDDVHDQAYVYSLSMTKPVDELEIAPGAGAYALDDVETFLRVGSFRYEQGNYETAIRILRQGQGLLIMPATARRLGLGVGDEIVLKTKRGRLPFRVAAVGGNPWFGTIMSRADAEQYFGVLPPLGYMITAKPGMDKGAVEAHLREVLEGKQGYMFFRLGRGSAVVDNVIGQPFRVLSMLLNGIMVLALVAASLGQINTMTMSVIERVREFGVLRSVGMTRDQVRGLVLLEAACVGVMGALIGGLAGMSGVLMYTLTSYTSAVEAMGFGSPTWSSVSTSVGSALQGVALIAALALVAAPLLTMLAAWSPARMAAHLPIIEAIRHEAAALRRR
jgi:putative ABC transport system permease protein